MSSSNQMFVYDFTMNYYPKGFSGPTGVPCMEEILVEVEHIFVILDKIAKKWVFQLELGDNSGYIHWQGRMSLHKKCRESQAIQKCYEAGMIDFRLSITSRHNMGNDFYVVKEETRIVGPWSEKQRDVEKRKRNEVNILDYLVNQWRPWQSAIIDLIDEYIGDMNRFKDNPTYENAQMLHIDVRSIYCIVNFTGNIGKSLLCNYLETSKRALSIPLMNNYQDIMAMVLSQDAKLAYTVDMPKAIDKRKLGELYASFEGLKNGRVFDKRYQYQQRRQDPAFVLVFSNEIPDFNYLSKDRWQLYTVRNNELICVGKELHEMSRVIAEYDAQNILIGDEDKEYILGLMLDYGIFQARGMFVMQRITSDFKGKHLGRLIVHKQLSNEELKSMVSNYQESLKEIVGENKPACQKAGLV